MRHKAVNCQCIIEPWPNFEAFDIIQVELTACKTWHVMFISKYCLFLISVVLSSNAVSKQHGGVKLNPVSMLGMEQTV